MVKGLDHSNAWLADNIYSPGGVYPYYLCIRRAMIYST